MNNEITIALRCCAALMIFLDLAACATLEPWTGLAVSRGTAGGVKVEAVLGGSPAETAGIVPGDEIVRVNDQAIQNPSELATQFKRAGIDTRVRLQLVDPPRTVEVTVLRRPPSETLRAQERSQLVGHPAPDFTPSIQAGPARSKLSELRGQVVLLDFWATWCPPCIETMPQLEQLHERLAKHGLAIIGISPESPEIVVGAARKYHLTYSLGADENHEISSRYLIFAYPAMVVIDRQGMVREVSRDWKPIDAAVEAALRAK